MTITKAQRIYAAVLRGDKDGARAMLHELDREGGMQE
jgi:hypothetical protein